MNLGGLFNGFSNNSTNNLFGKNSKTLLIILIIVIVIFGFGYGRGIFGGLNTGYGQRYGQVAGFGYVDPNSKKRRKHKRHHHHSDDPILDDGEVAFGYSAAGYGVGPGAYGPGLGYGNGLAGYGYPYSTGGIFGNDWFFIIAIIALLFLVGNESNENQENVNLNCQ